MSSIETKIEALQAIRDAEALKIEAKTAEVMWRWGDTLDPYGDQPESSDGCVGRLHFARRAEGEPWVLIDDLPDEVRIALMGDHEKWARAEEKLEWFSKGLKSYPQYQRVLRRALKKYGL